MSSRILNRSGLNTVVIILLGFKHRSRAYYGPQLLVRYANRYSLIQVIRFLRFSDIFSINLKALFFSFLFITENDQV